MWHNASLSRDVALFRNDPHTTSTAGWRLIISPRGMPACVTPRGTSHSPTGLWLCIHVFCFSHRYFFTSSRVSFLLPSAPGHGGSPHEHHGAGVGPSQGPWHVLWGLNVTSNYGEAFRARRSIQAHANPRTGKKKVQRFMWYLGSRKCRETCTWWWKGVSSTPNCETRDRR